MTLFFISFIAGVLTVLAPCILPLLPIIVGGSVTDAHSRMKPVIITASLALSVIVFTLLLKATTALIDIPPQTWKILSGGLLIIFGLITIFPNIWEKISAHLQPKKANALIAKGTQKKSVWGDILIGAALGPVFTSCSPTYAVIVFTVLPLSYASGMIYLGAYVLGLSLVLLLIAYVGQKLTKKLAIAANPHGLFKKSLGILFMLVGIAVLTGFDKEIEGRILDTGIYDGISNIENTLIDTVEIPQ